MADTKLNQFVSCGSAAARAAYTPSPPTPASGPTPGYFWHETDTGDTYSWKAGTGWIKVNSAAASSFTSWKTSVRAATTSNGTLATAFENGDTIDGVTLATGDRILIKNQSTASENGIYTVNASGAPTRATDADTGAEMLGAIIPVEQGTVNADKIFKCTNDATITLGSTNLVFIEAMDLASAGSQGDILYRGANGWQRLAAGTSGNFLKTQGAGADPAWAAVTGGSSQLVGVPYYDPRTGTSFSANFWGGRYMLAPFNMDISHVCFWSITAVGTALLTPAIYSASGLSISTLLAQGSQVTGSAIGLNELPLTSNLSVSRGTPLWVGMICLTSAVSLGSKSVTTDSAFFSQGSSPAPSTPGTTTYGGGTTQWANFFVRGTPT